MFTQTSVILKPGESESDEFYPLILIDEPSLFREFSWFLFSKHNKCEYMKKKKTYKFSEVRTQRWIIEKAQERTDNHTYLKSLRTRKFNKTTMFVLVLQYDKIRYQTILKQLHCLHECSPLPRCHSSTEDKVLSHSSLLH